jgi:hypothetical protein
MRAPFRASIQALIVLTVASGPLSARDAHPHPAGPAVDAPAAAPPDAAQLPSTPLTPAGWYSSARAGLPVECAPLGPSRFRLLDWWRQWFMTHWQQRQEEVERPPATPFYLRSPLLTGFLGRGDSTGCAGGAAVRQDAAEECAKLNLAPGAAKPVHLEVPLPQLEARSARRLGAVINEKLERGESVVVVLRGGQKVPVGPPLTFHVDARACRPDVQDQ